MSFEENNTYDTQGQQQPSGPPYAPQTASLGGHPSVIPDVPITSVFLLLYVIFGIIHFMIFRKNKARDHKFVFSAMMFGKLSNCFPLIGH